MEDIKIVVKQFGPLKNIKTIGHQVSDGWWHIYLPHDKQWHFVPAWKITKRRAIYED